MWVSKGGKRFQQPAKLAQEIQRRLDCFQAGKVSDLWDSIDIANTSTRRSRRIRNKTKEDDTLSPSTVSTIRGLVEEGAFAKATKHLTSSGLADLGDPAVAEKLRNLHPRGSSPTFSEALPLPSSLPSLLPGDEDEWEQWCIEATARFPAGSAPGPSGLRPADL